MNKQYPLKFWATALVTIAIAGLLASSVFNVVASESGDGLRALLNSTLLLTVVVLGCVLLNQGVKTKNSNAILKMTGILSIYMVILLAFVYFDYGLGGSLNLEKFDSRLRLIITNAIWIPCTMTALVFFYMYSKARELFGKKVPPHVVLLEYAVGALAMIGSAWGTFDGITLLSNGDWGLALVTAIGVDFMLFLMGAWHIAANDEVTSNITFVGKMVYALLALSAQVLDGVMRTTGVSGNETISRIGWSIIPFIGIGSGVFVLALYLTDKYYGGVSLGNRPAMPASMSRNQFALPTPTQTFGAEAPMLGVSVTSAMRESLLDLGYSNEEIDKMKPQEAQGRIKSQVLHGRGANHSDPKA